MLSFLYVYSDHSILECYNLFSGVELSMRSFFVISDTSSSDCKHKQTLHRKWHGTKHSRSDSSPDRGHITKTKRRKRFEETTMDSESEVRLDTEVDTAVDSDNEPTPNLCYLEVETEKNKTKTNTVNLKLPDSTGKKRIKMRNN